MKQTLGFVDLSYHLPLDDKSQLAFGLKGGINVLRAGLTDLNLGDGQADQAFSQNITSDLLPNFGAGLYYYRDKFYAGVSVPKFLENDFSADGNTAISTSSEERHYFLIAGGVVDINEVLKFKPTGFAKFVDGAPLQFDLTASLLIYDKFSAGVMYRSFGDAGVILGYQFTDQLRAGYAFDYPLTTLNRYHGWSHEIMISYDFVFKNKSKIRSPRYF